jgi:hypothetical protein
LLKKRKEREEGRQDKRKKGKKEIKCYLGLAKEK